MTFITFGNSSDIELVQEYHIWRREMAHNVVGRLQAFDPEAENISPYLERVQLYFDANEVADVKKVAVLLTVIGPKNYGIIRSLVAPREPKDKTFVELVAVLKGHFQPEPLVIAERHRFYTRSQGANESVLEFVADLRRLAITCDFGDFLNQALRDRFVCGLREETVQRRLLTEENLTLTRALEIAQAKEAASKNVRGLKAAGGASGPATTTLMQVSGSVDTTVNGKPCYRCGRRGHDDMACKFRQAQCHNCGKVGHIAPVCKSSRKPADRKFSGHRTKFVETSEQPQEDATEELGALAIGGVSSTRPIHVDVHVSGKPLTMVLDTGAAVSILSEDTFKKMFPKDRLHPSNLRLKTYTGEPMNVVGEFPVKVRYKQQPTKVLDLIIVRGDGPCLMGRSWLKHIQLDWKMIGVVSEQALPDLLEKYQNVFSDALGTMHPFKASLSVSKDARPKFCKARPVPYALRGAVEEELDRLESTGVLEKVDHSDWAAPIVAVPKRDGNVRICGDYKVTVNPVLEIDQYPLPKPEDLFATLSGGRKFTTLDLSHAYNQLELDESSQKYVTINTLRGLYKYKRLPFGIASAPAVFQKTMDTILQGMNNVICYIDDILVTGGTEAEHLSNLEEVLKRLREHGLVEPPHHVENMGLVEPPHTRPM